MPTPAIYPVVHHLDDYTTLGEVLMAREAGADGVFLIDHKGGNRLPGVAGKVRRYVTDHNFKIGINLLGWSVRHAFDMADAQGMNMVWFDAPGFDSGSISSECADMLEHIAANRPEPRPEIFAGVAFKHQPHEPDPVGAARTARMYGMVPTTSGPATGEPPALDKIASMAAHGQPLAVASGMTPANVAPFVPHLSHILVATGVSKDFHHFDFELLSTFVGAVRRAAQTGEPA